ncbi:Putative peptidyl-prolyl cis-trans isomerase Cbf2 [bacterium HR40]|nr:Putative peptidyl-prolyl cis-trans isomerase Cbf2 [bacterium HR40]
MIAKSASVALALLLAAPALAEESAPDPVVAEINGEPVYMSEVARIYEELPEQYRQLPFAAIAKPLLERAIDDRLLQAEAQRAGLETDPAVQREIERAKGRVLRTALLQQLVDRAMSEDNLRATYERMKAEPEFVQEQVCASHILLENEADAKAVIAELDKGADFGEVARARSTEPGGSKGGDIGCFPRGSMVPEFEAVAFALEPGTYTKEPVQSRFGWHVIAVREKKKDVPSFEAAQEQVRERAARDAIEARLGEVRAQAQIVRHDEVLARASGRN